MEETLSSDSFDSVRIKFLALGSSACRVLNTFVLQQMASANNCLAIDTDRSCLDGLHEKLPTYCFGEDLFRGFGSGGDVEWVQKHFQLQDEHLRVFFQQTHLLVILVGLSGGTGSGTIDAVLTSARQAGLFTVVIPLMPFSFEGHHKNGRAQTQLQHLQSMADLVLPFYSDLLFQILPETASAGEALEEGYRLLSQSLRTFSDGLHPKDNAPLGCRLNDFIHHFDNKPDALIWGVGSGNGEQAAKQALQAALECPMLRVQVDTFIPQRACLFLQTPSELPLNTLKTLYGDLQSRVNIANLPLLTSCSVWENDQNETTVLLILTACTKNLKTERFRKKRSKKAVGDNPDQTQLDFGNGYAESYWDTPTYLRRGLKLE